MQIHFYDVSETQELSHLNGQLLTFRELYLRHLACRPYWPALPLDLEQFSKMDFHPYGDDRDGWKSWINYFSTATMLLSGHSVSKEEAKAIRGYLRRLPNEFKRSKLDHKFVLSFVAYLFIGFKAHTHLGFASNSNGIDALVAFTLALCTVERVLVSSFLCAHRDPKIGEALNLLQTRIPADKIRRGGALVLALTHNASDEVRGRAVFLQQGVSATATSSIFPEVTVEYFQSARAHEMLDRLQYHFSRVASVLASLPGNRITARLVTLDVFTTRIERFLKHRYGVEWRHKDFTSYEFDEDPIVQIAVDLALPHIRRMMPFFSDDFQRDVLSRKHEIIGINRTAALAAGGDLLADKVVQVIEWFMLQHSMTISAKAVYETTFYHLWGRYVGKFNGAVAVGFDRDHDSFQHFAWERGVCSEDHPSKINQHALLYARRNPNGREHGVLADLSFRQFWRYN